MNFNNLLSSTTTSASASQTNGLSNAQSVSQLGSALAGSTVSAQQSSTNLTNGNGITNGVNGHTAGASNGNLYTPNGNGATATPNSFINNTASKLNLQQQITNGLFIRKEIQRFESVHPNIYTVYDLVDSIADFNLQQQLREHIVNIEGMMGTSFLRELF